jgi:hypothetical protein
VRGVASHVPAVTTSGARRASRRRLQAICEQDGQAVVAGHRSPYVSFGSSLPKP